MRDDLGHNVATKFETFHLFCCTQLRRYRIMVTAVRDYPTLQELSFQCNFWKLCLYFNHENNFFYAFYFQRYSC